MKLVRNKHIKEKQKRTEINSSETQLEYDSV